MSSCPCIQKDQFQQIERYLLFNPLSWKCFSQCLLRADEYVLLG
jgi:hypothetical protein